MQNTHTHFLSIPQSKIVERAKIYSKTLNKNLDLPKDISKSVAVKSKAEQQKEHIIYTIEAAKYQQQLYRKKESQDLETRHQYEHKIHEKQVKNLQKMKQNYKIKAKKALEFNRHFKEVGKRYDENQEKRKNHQKQQAIKLRNQLLEFYQKEKIRKLKAEKKQLSVGVCYNDAVERINLLHHKNQEYSLKTASQIEDEFARNNKFQQNISQRRRSLSIKNREKEQVYLENICILQEKQHRFIQKSGKNEDGYLSAWDKIEKTVSEMRKKRKQESKRNLDRWKQCKKRADDSKAFVSQKCLSLIDKTSKATFQRTMSLFRNTARSFDQVVQNNKKVIKQIQDKKRDQIIDLHLDMRLRNTSSAKITQRMLSMRQNASLITSQL